MWADFPQRLPSGKTSILLQLSNDYDTDELERELKSLDPRLLLFLRKLKQIDVAIINKKRDVATSTLKRSDVAASIDGANMIDLKHDFMLSRFKIIKRMVENMPDDPKREGCTISQLLLAFPTSLRGEPWIAPPESVCFPSHSRLRLQGLCYYSPRREQNSHMCIASFSSKPTFCSLQAVKMSTLLRHGTTIY